MRCAQESTGRRSPWGEEAQGQACAWVWEVAPWKPHSRPGACRGVALGRHFGSRVEVELAVVVAAAPGPGLGAAQEPCRCSRSATGGRRRVSVIDCQSSAGRRGGGQQERRGCPKTRPGAQSSSTHN